MTTPVKMTNKAREAAKSLAIRYAYYRTAAGELRDAHNSLLVSQASILARNTKLAKALAEWSDLLLDAQEVTGVKMVEPLTLLIHRQAARDAVEAARLKQGD